MQNKITFTQALKDKVHGLRAYGLTLRQVGQRLGLAESTIHKIEKGKP